MNRESDPMMQRCRDALSTTGREGEILEVFVPGRIELFGKHTDYAGGSSILCATDRGFRMASLARTDGIIRMIPAEDPERAESFSLGRFADKPQGHWLHYPATTAKRVASNFGDQINLSGADIAFLSDLPAAAGMSSSSAFMVGTFLVLGGLFNLEDCEAYHSNITNREDLTAYLGCIENGQNFRDLKGEAGVGTFGGSEDHTAMLCSLEGQLVVYRFHPTRFERVIRWDDSLKLVVATSGIAAEKTGEQLSDYNRASLRASLVVETYNRITGTSLRHLGELAEATSEEKLEEVLQLLHSAESDESELSGMNLAGRFEQFFNEERIIIPEAVEALERSDWNTLGDLADRSHAGAVTGLENQIVQTNSLQQIARESNAVAASAFGAGFGGSVWATVTAERADEFASEWQQTYRNRFPEDAGKSEILIFSPGTAASIFR